MQRNVLWCLVLGMLLVGCGRRAPRREVAKPTIYSLPTQDGQKLGSAKYPFPAGVGPGRMEAYFQGMAVRKQSGYPVDALRIQVSCENDTDHALCFDTTESHLVDNRGDLIRCSAAWRDGAEADSFEEVAAHAHAQFDLFFDVPLTYPLEKLESFRVYWRYKVGDRAVAENTNFIRYPTVNMWFIDRSGKRKAYDYFLAIRDAGDGKGGAR